MIRITLILSTLVLTAGVLAVGFLPSGDPVAAEAPTASERAPAAEPAPVADPAAQSDRQERVREAIDRGLAYLATTQDRASGGWIQDVGFKFNDRYEVTVSGQPHVGVTALALMAFLAGGHIPGRGRYGDVVMHGTDFILQSVDTDTGFISANETRMYSHAFASLFLAEIYGMTHRTDVQEKLQQAIDLTVKTQNSQGSWRYRPYAPDSDMSIAVCQLMALRAARNIGIQVPRSTIDRAYDYISKSAYRRGPNKGAFKYQIDQNQTRYSFALGAAGLASLMHAGFYEDEMIKPGINWLKGRIRNLQGHETFPTYFYWYGHYYAAQVMFIAGDKDQEIWDRFYWPLISEELIVNQSRDGSWNNNPGPGDMFGTAVACIILQIPYQYLPIFQR